MGKKIREAQLQKIPWQLVVGQREAEAGQVAVRLLRGGDQGQVSVDAFIEQAEVEVAARAPLPERPQE